MDGITLKDYIKAKGMSVPRIAERIGIDRSTLYAKLTGGKPEFTASEILKLSEILNTSTDKILEMIDNTEETKKKPKHKIIFENDILLIKETGRNFDFIATIENKSKNRIEIIFDNEELDRIEIEPEEWTGILTDTEGALQTVELIEGHFNIDSIDGETAHIERRNSTGEKFEGMRRKFENYETTDIFTGKENEDGKEIIKSTIRVR